MFHRFVGDRAFYRRIFAIAIPIIIQNGITNFVSLLDNIMVGSIGPEQMSGVAIANQLLFVFNLCIFGASSGAGIFTAQFHGSGDHEGVRHTFRFKLLACTALTIAGSALLLCAGKNLIGLYLQGEGDPMQAQRTLGYGLDYLGVMIIGLIPFALANCYSSTLRESGQTVVPMVAGIVAVFVNLAGNYILIFGHLGLPAMGVKGAALATVASRFVELAIVAVWTHCHGKRHPFICGAFRSAYIPGRLCLSIFRKGMPLLINEFLWASGMAILNQCYSRCGLDVVPASNISGVLFNLGSVAFLALGNAVGILMGQMLGACRPEQEIRDTNRKLLALSVSTGIIFGGLVAAASGAFPQLYKASASIRLLATQMLIISSIMMPFNAFTNATYFTLRSGGQTAVTFLFDSCFVWLVCVPLAYCLSRFTAITIIPLYAICQGLDLIKCILGSYMLKKGKWIQNLTQ